MKKLIWLAVACAISSVGSVYAEELEFRAVNPVLQTLVDAVISADDLVDFAYPRFDESFCDLKAEKLKYDLQGSLKNTPWLAGGSADILGSTTYVADRSPNHPGITMTLISTVRRTDVLALTRYAANLALRKSYPLKPKFDERYRAHLKRLAVATSLNQVYDLLLSGRLLAKDLVLGEISKEEDYIKCVQSGECGGDASQIDYANRKIADWKGTLPAYDLPIEAKRENDRVREIRLTSADISGFVLASEKVDRNFLFVPGAGGAVITEDSISANGSAFYKMDAARMNGLKTKYEKLLIGVQNGNAEDKDEMQKGYRNALSGLKNVIRGEF